MWEVGRETCAWGSLKGREWHLYESPQNGRELHVHGTKLGNSHTRAHGALVGRTWWPHGRRHVAWAKWSAPFGDTLQGGTLVDWQVELSESMQSELELDEAIVTHWEIGLLFPCDSCLLLIIEFHCGNYCREVLWVTGVRLVAVRFSKTLSVGVVAVNLCGEIGSHESLGPFEEANLLEGQVPHGLGADFWQVGAKSKVLPKFMGPSRLKEELGSIEMRLDKVEVHLTHEEARVDRIEDHLIQGDDRFEELESRLSELSEGLEETRGKLQAALKETRAKLVHENEVLKLVHAKEMSTMKEDNRVLKEMVERMHEEMKEMREEMVLLKRLVTQGSGTNPHSALRPYGKGGETQAVHIQGRRKRKGEDIPQPRR
ncbi:hypothetical protein GH714_020799 [Hevea brasiliensis]|uniref:Uncharacterized protein n=1 Tax=Hevea brasiliensis TaxID=3981 RepID=A0A6A6L9V8_HEVBR|nr:hypothetical protein GH714_020799 [Hevea brasiliensis]